MYSALGEGLQGCVWFDFKVFRGMWEFMWGLIGLASAPQVNAAFPNRGLSQRQGLTNKSKLAGMATPAFRKL